MDALPALLDARQPGEVQLAALQAIGGLPDRRVGPVVVARWRALSPSVRREAAEVLFANAERLGALLDAFETKDLNLGELDPAPAANRILSHADAKVRERGAKVLGGEAKVDRRRVIESMKPALALAGDRERGRAVFVKTCSTCHKAEGRGEAIGPDLATITGRTPEDLPGPHPRPEPRGPAAIPWIERGRDEGRPRPLPA